MKKKFKIVKSEFGEVLLHSELEGSGKTRDLFKKKNFF